MFYMFKITSVSVKLIKDRELKKKKRHVITSSGYMYVVMIQTLVVSVSKISNKSFVLTQAISLEFRWDSRDTLTTVCN